MAALGSLPTGIKVTAWVVVAAAFIGALIGALRAQSDDILLEASIGGLIGFVIALGCTTVEFQLFANLRIRTIRRLPPFVLMVFRAAAYSFFIVLGLAIPGLILGGPLPWLSPDFAEVFAISALVAFTFSTGVEVTRLLGKEATIALVSGRYDRPRLEDRVVLFADIIGSTSLAEQIGELRFHDFLREVFQDLAEAIDASQGEVHKYVGDAVIVTWPMKRGVRNGACLVAAQRMHEAIAGRSAFYRGEYGLEARIRIALHCGTVAAGEIGDWKKEVAFLGDVMNTAARIENAARDYGVGTVLSDDLVQHLPTDARRALERLPNYTAAGKEIALALWTPSAPAPG